MTATATLTRTCSVDGCEKGGKLRRGVCSQHYRGARLERMAARGRKCTWGGCTRTEWSGGLCEMHYRRRSLDRPMDAAPGWQLRLADTCCVSGCDRAPECKGMCDMHYQRSRDGRDLEAAPGWQLNAPTCAVVGCARPTKAHNLCALHYGRSRASGDLTMSASEARVLARDDQGRKFCAKCSTWRPVDRFATRRNASKPTLDGLAPTCNACHRWATIRRKYGITRDAWLALYADQGGRCAACGDAFTEATTGTPHVDHDHDDGHVRGLLCGHCNTGLGQFKDDPDRLRAAAEYLERDRSTQADA